MQICAPMHSSTLSIAVVLIELVVRIEPVVISAWANSSIPKVPHTEPYSARTRLISSPIYFKQCQSQKTSASGGDGGTPTLSLADGFGRPNLNDAASETRCERRTGGLGPAEM